MNIISSKIKSDAIITIIDKCWCSGKKMLTWTKSGLDSNCALYNIPFRGVVPGGAEGAMAPPDFGRSVSPISTRGADCARQIILAPLDFQTFLRLWDESHNARLFFAIYVLGSSSIWMCRILNICFDVSTATVSRKQQQIGIWYSKLDTSKLMSCRGH